LGNVAVNEVDALASVAPTAWTRLGIEPATTVKATVTVWVAAGPVPVTTRL
jgi:hypothetical protein